MAVNSNPPIQLDPSMDDGHKTTFINQNFQSLANSLSPFIISDGTGNSLQLGKQSDGSYSLKFFDTSSGLGTAEFKSGSFKVAKSGFEVSTTGNANLIFNSSQNVFKIVATGTTSLTKAINSSGATATIAHGLSFTPGVMSYVDDSGLLYPMPHLVVVDDGTATLKIGRKIAVTVDATNLYFTITTAGTGTYYSTAVSYNFRYYLLQETAN
jgi:hypothetical protein